MLFDEKLFALLFVIRNDCLHVLWDRLRHTPSSVLQQWTFRKSSSSCDDWIEISTAANEVTHVTATCSAIVARWSQSYMILSGTSS